VANNIIVVLSGQGPSMVNASRDSTNNTRINHDSKIMGTNQGNSDGRNREKSYFCSIISKLKANVN